MRKLNIICLIVLFFFAKSAKSQDILKVDGSFEGFDTITSPAGNQNWIFQTPAGNAIYKITDKEKHTGSNSAQINVYTLPKNYWDIQMGNENIPAPAGNFYKASFWAKSPTKFFVHAIIGYYNWSELAVVDVKLSSNWTKYNMVCFDSGKANIKDTLRVVFQKFTAGEYFFDDIVFTLSNIVNMEVVKTGDSLLVNTGIDLEPVPAVFENSSFVVKVNGIDNPVKAVSLKKGTKNIIVLKLSKIVMPGDIVNISHTGGKLSYAKPDELPDDKLGAFEGLVDNYSEQTVISGVDDIFNNEQFRIYPNPVKDILYFSCKEIPQEVYLFSTSGKLLGFAAKSTQISVSSLPQGCYLVKIIDNQGNSQYSKFIKH